MENNNTKKADKKFSENNNTKKAYQKLKKITQAIIRVTLDFNRGRWNFQTQKE